jgi:histidyl-tRNA synthetase
MAKKAETKPYKGTRDFLPEDIDRREHVTSIIRSVYEGHGFRPLETPAMERLETLLGKYGEEGDQLLFKVAKRGQGLVEGVREASEILAREGVVVGRTGETSPKAELLVSDIGLRYDLTVPLSRVYANELARLPAVFRRYQIQPVWRADNPGKGRFREFYQCDVDVIGTPSIVAEAEVAGAVAECLTRLGFRDFTIAINHRALLAAMIERAGIDPSKAQDAITVVDKLAKIGRDGVVAELAQKGVADAAGRTLLEMVEGADLAKVGALLAGHERGERAIADVRRVFELSKHTPASGFLSFDPSLARGLGYYTGCIFEIGVKDLAGSLGGGGRYDGLIGMFLGRDVPAVGFSIGLERILVVMEERGMFPQSIGRGPELLVAAVEEDRIEEALGLAYALRARGVRVELSPKVEKPGQARKDADQRGVPRALLVRSDGYNLWQASERDVTDRRVTPDELFAIVAGRRAMP